MLPACWQGKRTNISFDQTERYLLPWLPHKLKSFFKRSKRLPDPSNPVNVALARPDVSICTFLSKLHNQAKPHQKVFIFLWAFNHRYIYNKRKIHVTGFAWWEDGGSGCIRIYRKPNLSQKFPPLSFLIHRESATFCGGDNTQAGLLGLLRLTFKSLLKRLTF